MDGWRNEMNFSPQSLAGVLDNQMGHSAGLAQQYMNSFPNGCHEIVWQNSNSAADHRDVQCRQLVCANEGRSLESSAAPAQMRRIDDDRVR